LSLSGLISSYLYLLYPRPDLVFVLSLQLFSSAFLGLSHLTRS
jgi:hypothetical protein